MTGCEHKRQRQLIMPRFHKKAVDTYHDLMVEIATEMLNRWQAGQIDIHREIRALTLQVAGQVLFGHDPERAARLGRMLEDWQRRNFSSLVWLFALNCPGTAYRRLLRHAEKIEEEILSIINHRRANPGRPTDVLSLLIQARDEESRGMTDIELVGQATILFGASFETTAATLSWTIFLLAQHPAVMHELMEELDSVLDGRPPANEQLAQLSYLDCIIKESMRILPPVPFTIRATDIDTTKIGPLTLPHGTRVICSHYLTHHLPELYPKPGAVPA
jgi:cytochrome P450